MHEEMHIDSHFPQAFKVLERDERLAAEYGRRVLGNQQYPWRLALTNLWHQLTSPKLYTTKEPAMSLQGNETLGESLARIAKEGQSLERTIQFPRRRPWPLRPTP